MEHLPTFAVLRVRQNTIQPPLAATFPVVRLGSTVCYGNMPLAGHMELARLKARTGPPDPAFHPETQSNTRRYFNADQRAFERDGKGRLMLTRKNNDPMTIHAVGFSICWRGSS